MADLILAEKDAALVLATVLARYKGLTGVTLAPADPRRLHLQAIVLELAQQRQLIDFSGKQSLLRFVSAVWIQALAELWGEDLLPALPSTTILRYTASAAGILTIAAGKRATDGISLWSVDETNVSDPDATFIDCPASCTVVGSATNGVAINQIDAMVDQVPGFASVTNTTATISGRDIETTDAFRERLRDVPEARSTCGPRSAYQAAALAASASVADAVALGPEDTARGEVSYDGPTAGEVHVVIIKGTRAADGTLISVAPEPDAGLLNAVDAALSAETVRPLTDSVTVMPARFVDFTISAVYYVARSRLQSLVEIRAAVADAHAAYSLWQQSKIGRDINPSQLNAMIVNAGAKRSAITLPIYTPLQRDESARLHIYDSLVFGGVEDD